MNPTERFLFAVVAGLLMAVWPAEAALYTFSGPGGGAGTYSSSASGLNQLIPDNSPQGGIAYGLNFAATGLSISTLTLSFNMSGGNNGDMYGYLQHNGTLIELFNPGSFSANGAIGSTLNLTLSSSSPAALSGATASDLAGGNTYAASGNLGGFVSADPSGLWTLYFADESPGDQMTLNSFNLSLTAVPEPVNAALAIFAAFALLICRIRRQWRKKHGHAA